MLTIPDYGAWLLFVAAFFVGTLAVARFTRLVTEDDFPPILWLRTRWAKVTGDSNWGILLECPFCFAAWVALADLTWAWVSRLNAAWWFCNLWFAVAYLAAMVVLREIPEEPDDTQGK